MIVERKSPLNGKVNKLEINVTEEELDRWSNGELIQNVLPHLTADEREFLMTGITAEEWKEAFGENKG